MTGTHRADSARPAPSISHTRRLRRALVVLIVLGTAVALLGGRGGGAPLQASAASAIPRHAGSTTFQSGSASTALTAAPSDLRAGDVVVSYLETTSASGVLCLAIDKRDELLPGLLAEVAFEKLADIALVHPGALGRGRGHDVDAETRADLGVEGGLHGESSPEQRHAPQAMAPRLRPARLDDAEERHG